ncbi:hypothetical protein FEM48_ZijujUnG0062300 [Ziziphus jujuba var. spinosa]|uniref:Reverse transcriptase Ty1/copia-type domain-containing protein n=1 Tax=Ziziphus jujuba var. spinosa TaxID=714518 RepID=A0A978U8Y5_ZIZJJ|nr:hypothetical protein FEM48_ZijujUnG0062300 [Ziziphus jujuba var. spinosa]
MGHPSEKVVKLLPPVSNLKGSLNKACEICFRAKHPRDKFPLSDNKATRIFEKIHCDLWGSYKHVSSCGARYFLTIVDDFSSAVWIYLLVDKTEVFQMFMSFIAMVDRQFSQTVKIVQSDNDLDPGLREGGQAHTEASSAPQIEASSAPLSPGPEVVPTVGPDSPGLDNTSNGQSAPMGKGMRDKFPSVLLRDFVTHTVVAESPSPATSSPQHPSAIISSNDPKSIKEAMKDVGYGFLQSYSDYSLFTYTKGNIQINVLVYVDDLIISANDSATLKTFKAYLSDCFKMKDLGALKYFLGIEVARSSAGLFLCQRKYTLDIVSKARLLGAKPWGFPIEQNHRLGLANGELLSNPESYRRLVGRLIYLAVTPPDLAYSVHILSQFMQEPRIEHWEAALRVIRYLKGTPSQGILLRADSDLSLHGVQLVTRGAKVNLTADRGLLLTDPLGQELWNTDPIPGVVVSGVMSDVGNFSLQGRNSNDYLWQTFENPSNAMLPTQVMDRGGVLYSLQSETNYFKGSPGIQFVFNQLGAIYVLRENGERKVLNNESQGKEGDNYLRLTLDYDGILTLYSQPKAGNSKSH